MTADPANAADNWQNWNNAVLLRWLLVDEFTMGQPDTVVAACAEIDGLFAGARPATAPQTHLRATARDT